MDPTGTGAASGGLRELLQRMPKAELHLHLDGSLRPATALELARERGLADGLTLRAMAARLAAPERCRDQAELLAAFDLPIAILQDAEALHRAAFELVEDVSLDGTRYVEIRWAPALHVRRGLSLRDGIAAVVAGARGGVRATGALDGVRTTGAPPATTIARQPAPRAGPGSGSIGTADGSGLPGVTVRLIAVAMRSHDPADNIGVATASTAFIADGLTGFDLAGLEARYPDPLVHARAFDVARRAGLGITVHAGEWGDARQVWRALALEPARIAHGSPAAGDPALMAELRARGVTLDLCPTSNAQAGIVPTLEAHPLPRLFRAGVPVTLSTDDRTVSRLTLVEEYHRAAGRLGMSPAELWSMNRHALDAAFLREENLRSALAASFDAFAAHEPALGGAGAVAE